MVRLILLCVIFASSMGGAYWLSQNSGSLSFVFLDYNIETTVTEFVIYGAIALVILQILLFWLYRIFSIPAKIKQKIKDKRKDKVIANIAGFFSDYVSKDTLGLEKRYRSIKELLEPVDQLSIGALIEEASGNNAHEKNKLIALTKFDKTKIGAFSRLIDLSMLEKDWFISANYCSELWKLQKTPELAYKYVLCFINARRWRELEELLSAGSLLSELFHRDLRYYLGKESAKTIHALCKYKIAQDLVDFGDIETASSGAQYAAKVLEGFLPATMLALKTCDDESSKIKLIKRQWKVMPHYSMNELILDISKKAIDQKFYKTVKNIVSVNYEHYESSLILARAALDIDDFDLASKHMSDAIAGVKKVRAFLLMAEFCQRTHANKAEVVDWLRQAQSAENDRPEIEFYWDFAKAAWTNAPNERAVFIEAV